MRRRSGAGRGRRRTGAIVGLGLVGLGLWALLGLPADDVAGPGTPGDGGGATAEGSGSDVPARSLDRPDPEGLPAPWDRIRVEVLNAGGVPGMAARATDLLRSAGFDVVYFGNAAAFDRIETAVLDRAGNPTAADAVARALNVGAPEAAPDPERLVDVTVLLGRAWDPDVVPDLPDGEGDPWWKPRRLLDRMGVPR